MLWDKFLAAVADTYQLEGDLSKIFLTRFATKNQKRTLPKIALDLHTSEATLGRRLNEIYETFVGSCPTLGNTTGPTKSRILREWLEEEYQHFQETGKLPQLSELSSISPTEIIEKIYIERPELEAKCDRALLKPGALVRLKAPREMGKTWLIRHIFPKLGGRDYRRAIFSLKLADLDHFSDLDKFLRWLCTQVSCELELSPQLNEYWVEHGGSKSNCTRYFESYLLPADNSPLVLCLDDVDLVFNQPAIYQDFAALLRSWHERGNSRQIWKRLRLAIVYSTEAYIPLDINQSPFNVGEPIEVPELTREEIKQLARHYGLNWNSARIEQLIELVGGHPHLIQQAFVDCYRHRDRAVEDFFAIAPTEAGIYNTHLRLLWQELHKNPELAIAFKKVIFASQPVKLNPLQSYHLNRLGLVKSSNNTVQLRCQLYYQYFRDRLEDIG